MESRRNSTAISVPLVSARARPRRRYLPRLTFAWRTRIEQAEQASRLDSFPVGEMSSRQDLAELRGMGYGMRRSLDPA